MIITDLNHPRDIILKSHFGRKDFFLNSWYINTVSPSNYLVILALIKILITIKSGICHNYMKSQIRYTSEKHIFFTDRLKCNLWCWHECLFHHIFCCKADETSSPLGQLYVSLQIQHSSYISPQTYNWTAR